MLVNLKTIFFIIHFLCVFCMGSDRDHWSSYRHYPTLHGWIKLYYEPADWMTARTNCHNEDALLASPWTEEFTATLYEIMSPDKSMENETDYHTVISYLHSGAQLSFSEGVFTDVQGVPTITKEQCNLKRNCIALTINSTMANVSCEEKLPYVCYAPLNPEPGLNCGDKNLGYQFDERTGLCYKFRDVGHGWEDSRKICQEEGGDLAVINSDEEATFLKNLYANYTTLYYTYHNFHVYVGIHEKGINNTWTTIYGETLEEAGYARWADGEPDNKQSNWPDYVKNARQSCGTMDREGHYSDCWCEMQHAYICEKRGVKLLHTSKAATLYAEP